MLPAGPIRFAFRHFAACLTIFLGLISTPALAGTSCSMTRLGGADRIVQPGKAIDQALVDALILAEINYQRCRSGLKPLVSDVRVRKVALGHARWMASTQRVSHRSSLPGQGTLRARISTSGIDKVRVGSENVGMVHRFRIDGQSFRPVGDCSFVGADGGAIGAHTYGSLAHKIVTLWMNSSGHRVNILDRKVTMTGAAAVFANSSPYCGQFFVAQNFVG